MKYLIVEPITKNIAPNIALLKWCKWCEINGHEYEYVRGFKTPIKDNGRTRYEKVIPKIEPDKILMSCIFSYFSKKYYDTIEYYHKLFPEAEITVGGMFPTINEKWFIKHLPYVNVYKGMCQEIENLTPKYSVDPENNHIVLYSSRGCVNKCGYCMVPKLEGKLSCMKSISEFLYESKEEFKLMGKKPTSVVLYDNNFTEHHYFDNIMNDLIDFGLAVDIHGLHVDSMDEHKAKRFSELKWASQHEKGTAYMRFSFDYIGYRKHVRSSLQFVHDAGIKAGFFCYLLWNWRDHPNDFLRRILYSQQIVDEVGRTIFLFPQRYEPLNGLKRNQYISPKWKRDDVIRGIVKMYTYIHGFIPLTKTRNIFRWIGYSKREFFTHVLGFAHDKEYGKRFKENKVKREGIDPPDTKRLAKDYEVDL